MFLNIRNKDNLLLTQNCKLIFKCQYTSSFFGTKKLNPKKFLCHFRRSLTTWKNWSRFARFVKFRFWASEFPIQLFSLTMPRRDRDETKSIECWKKKLRRTNHIYFITFLVQSPLRETRSTLTPMVCISPRRVINNLENCWPIMFSSCWRCKHNISSAN